ncbi:hypothetical protein F5X98DRAFT_135090 [Xylaria grammica]|nr:hypothetical protein F5X98DRAFT_135090 [Xylaria grammica]
MRGRRVTRHGRQGQTKTRVAEDKEEEDGEREREREREKKKKKKRGRENSQVGSGRAGTNAACILASRLIVGVVGLLVLVMISNGYDQENGREDGMDHMDQYGTSFQVLFLLGGFLFLRETTEQYDGVPSMTERYDRGRPTATANPRTLRTIHCSSIHTASTSILCAHNRKREKTGDDQSTPVQAGSIRASNQGGKRPI